MRAAILVGVAYLLVHTIAQCAFAVAHGESEPAHVLSASTIETELSPAHAHIGEVAGHAAHGEHAVASLPRVENPLRLFALAVAILAVAAASMLWSAPAPRAPPAVSEPARQGRAVLIELCIDRC
ncbi:hypothetical protein [Rhodococcus daqingensis]|uniref:Lipoprotein LpqS n=1 Tax=Rhodococcus daqingensis TaxID=2479363 RepID=A0ABW2RU05_9NOCA